MMTQLAAVAAGKAAAAPWSGLTDPEALLQGLGGWALGVVAVIVFIESGVLFPFLPGDSLIFTAGLLHGSLGLNLAVLIAVIVSAAFLGDQIGYWLGRRFGRRLFADNAKILKTRYLLSAETFFNRYGGRSLVLARFVPFARTFVPLAAGIAHYQYRKFLLWNALGALLWGAGLTVAGSLLGGVPFIAGHVDLIALVIVVASVVPTVVEVIRQVRRNRAAPHSTGITGDDKASRFGDGVSTARSGRDG
ncbi:membrane-associated protein [Arthrobacter subterraneus]|uniref:Membrane-associated protein n=1 Tax=Arthrobacter subterraneus TaxID=335973 RepID=A0A1G8PAU1_9MICC|nr:MULTISPECIES: VTT domain-containing protein [Arthrobacter]SDI89415.1 membrane-associated protein [Arthrobacter subterraneus]